MYGARAPNQFVWHSVVQLGAARSPPRHPNGPRTSWAPLACPNLSHTHARHLAITGVGPTQRRNHTPTPIAGRRCGEGVRRAERYEEKGARVGGEGCALIGAGRRGDACHGDAGRCRGGMETSKLSPPIVDPEETNINISTYARLQVRCRTYVLSLWTFHMIRFLYPAIRTLGLLLINADGRCRMLSRCPGGRVSLLLWWWVVFPSG